MTESLHTIQITGRLGRDPEHKRVGEQSVLEMSVAANHRAKLNGQWGDVTTWYRVSVWGRRAESLAKLLGKGDHVAVSGRLEPRTYTGRDGAERVSLEIQGAEVVLLGSKRDAAERGESRFAAPPRLDRDDDGRGYSGVAEQGAGVSDDDLPF